MHYRRLYIKGAIYFFTVVTYQRKKIFSQRENIKFLRKAINHVKKQHPFKILGFVLLADHLHCLWELPEDDDDFSMRWRLIKAYFSRLANNHKKTKTPIWQKRFWEHCIRNEKDLTLHLNYIHYNPVKHGYVQSTKNWQYSSFLKYVKLGYYPLNWAESSGIVRS